jgi:hypothetical protein
MYPGTSDTKEKSALSTSPDELGIVDVILVANQFKPRRDRVRLPYVPTGGDLRQSEDNGVTLNREDA